MKQPKLFASGRPLPDAFEEFWRAYPPRRPNPRARAERIFAQLVRRGVVGARELVEACTRYAREVRELGLELRFVPHAATWLRQERWRDYLVDPEEERDSAQTAPALPTLARELGPVAYRVWIEPLRLEREGDRVRIVCPSALHRERVRQMCHDMLAAELGTRRLDYVVVEEEDGRA